MRKVKPKPPEKKEEPKERPVETLCPCGSNEVIWVHSHYQCAKCGRILHSCCEGEPYT